MTAQYGLVGECVECGGRMIEEHRVYGEPGEKTHVGLLCEDCDEDGRVGYVIGGKDSPRDPSIRENVTDITTAKINWIDCPRCHGGGWIEDPLCDLAAATNGRDTPCPNCHTSGSVPRVVEGAEA